MKSLFPILILLVCGGCITMEVPGLGKLGASDAPTATIRGAKGYDIEFRATNIKEDKR